MGRRPGVAWLPVSGRRVAVCCGGAGVSVCLLISRSMNLLRVLPGRPLFSYFCEGP